MESRNIYITQIIFYVDIIISDGDLFKITMIILKKKLVQFTTQITKQYVFEQPQFNH